MAVTTYAEYDDVLSRLSDGGILYVVDDDGDGTVSPYEKARVTDAIESAAGEINAALRPFFTVPISQTSGSLNAWLKTRAVDLSLYYLCLRRGGAVPGSVQAQADLSRELLERVRKDELRVPELSYPAEAVTQEELDRIGLPVVANVRCR